MSSDVSTSSSGENDGPGPSSGNSSSGVAPSMYEDEMTFLDILVVIARNRSLILWTIVVFTAIGLTYSLVASEKYTSSAKVVREAKEEGVSLPGGLPTSALSGLGINLGGASSGLTPQAFPDVLRSREVQLAVVRDTFAFPDVKRPMTFSDYVNRPPGPFDLFLKYTLWLPFTVKNTLSDTLLGTPARVDTNAAEAPPLPTEEEDRALEAIAEMVSSSVDDESGLMTISVTAEGPRLAAAVTQSFVGHLKTRVRELRTEKVRERLEFVRQRFREVKEELEAAEDRLAQFLERNQNPTTASLQFQRDRLRRQVSFKEQLYGELQSQLTQTRLDLQRRRPVVTVVEEPVPPVEKSAPYRTLIVLVSMILGGVVGVGAAFVRMLFIDRSEEPEGREKIREIQETLVPGFLMRMVESRSD